MHTVFSRSFSGVMEEDDPVELYDVLSAMASSLVETDSFFNVTTVPDRPVDNIKMLGGKPPREVFYNKTITFMTSLVRYCITLSR